jgi:hypothetical protein
MEAKVNHLEFKLGHMMGYKQTKNPIKQEELRLKEMMNTQAIKI